MPSYRIPRKPKTPWGATLLTRAIPLSICCAAFPVIVTLICFLPTANATPAAPEEITLFAFDNQSILFTRNLRLEMHQPQKHQGNPVLPRGDAGMPDEYGVQFYGSVIEDQGKFRLWYVAIDEDLKKWPHVDFAIWRPSYAESTDGIHWKKPELDLVEYKGSKQNNLLEILPAPLGIINLKVIRDNDDPDPSRRYKMTAQAWWVGHDGKGGRGTLAPLVSPDGFTWRLVGDVQVQSGRIPTDSMFLPQHHFEAGSGLYKWNDVFYITGQSNSGHFAHGTTPYSGREVLVHRSTDFDHWESSAHVAFVREGQYRSFEYGHGEESHEGVSVWHRHNVLLGIYGRWHGGDGWDKRTIDLGFVISNNGTHFREPMTEWTMIPRGDDGAWDQGGLLQGQGFANVGDKTYIYYGAWDPRPGGIDPEDTYPPRGGVGLATLQRDRFGSLSMRQAERSAQFTTAEITIPANTTPRFYLNADGLGEAANLRFELLDSSEQPITGFSGKDSAVADTSGYHTKIEFPPSSTSSTLPSSVRLRVIFDGGEAEGIEFSAIYATFEN